MTQFKAFLVAIVMSAAGMLAALPAVAAMDYATGDMAIGREDAPVTVIEYASMTCPHCAHFHTTTFKAFKEKYIDTGKVRLIFREFPFDQYALQASMLARCAGKDRYFGMVDVLFRQQLKWARSPKPTEELEKIGRLGGISKEQFESCLKNESLMNQILETRLKGNEEHGIDSTPSFLVNGDKYTGAMSLSEWDDILAKYLN